MKNFIKSEIGEFISKFCFGFKFVFLSINIRPADEAFYPLLNLNGCIRATIYNTSVHIAYEIYVVHVFMHIYLLNVVWTTVNEYLHESIKLSRIDRKNLE